MGGIVSNSSAQGVIPPQATGELRSYDPSLRDRIGDAVYDAFTAMGLPNKAQDARNITTSAADFLPAVGTALGADDTVRAAQAGNWGQTGVLGAMTALGALPILGGAGKGIGKLARGAFDLDYFGQPIRILQNPGRSEMAGFINRTKYKAARRITDPTTGETYIWDAGDPVLHQHVADQLGLSPQSIFDVVGSD